MGQWAATGRAGDSENRHNVRRYCRIGNILSIHCLKGKDRATLNLVYGRVLKEIRVSLGRSQADVARSVGISPAHLARLESNQRGLYVEDFVRIAEALGEKPGDLLPNGLGDIGHLKPIINRLASVRPEFLAGVASIIERIIQLTEEWTEKPGRKSKPAAAKKGRT